jgi:hypothetical protein
MMLQRLADAFSPGRMERSPLRFMKTWCACRMLTYGRIAAARAAASLQMQQAISAPARKNMAESFFGGRSCAKDPDRVDAAGSAQTLYQRIRGSG